MRIMINSGARLHLGFYNLLTDQLAYGSLGVGVEYPATVVYVQSSSSLKIVNESGVYVGDVVNEVLNKLGKPNAEIRVAKAAPRHVGLGSTTQLTLSLAYGLSKLLKLKYSIKELAVLFKRGHTSGIGIAVFESGGFIIDSGRVVRDGVVSEPRRVSDLPQVVFRKSLPRNWYFIVVVPEGIEGLSEREERKYLEVPYEPPKDLQNELRKLLLIHLIPSVIWRDIEVFGKSITRIQELVGKYFSRYQGGIYCCKETELAVKLLLKHGACGAGQSSWGPAAYGITEGSKRARRILEKVGKEMKRKGVKAKYYLVRARNRGALVEIHS